MYAKRVVDPLSVTLDTSQLCLHVSMSLEDNDRFSLVQVMSVTEST